MNTSGSDQPDEPNRNEGQRFERVKLAVDSVKHITTLATGTIVLLATFSDRLPRPLAFKGYLITAIVSMVVCLLASFIYLWGETLAPRTSQSILGLPIPEPMQKWKWLQWSGRRMLVFLSDVIYFSFCFGIYYLARFAIRNI